MGAEFSGPVTAERGVSRPLVLHYHFFKNAGTSVDIILQRNFPGAWHGEEFSRDPGADHGAAIVRLILARPELRAISSHSLRMPAPDIAGVSVLPVVFLRHPLDRVESAYRFQRERGEGRANAALAGRVGLADYVRVRLADPADRGFRDFQAFRLAMAAPDATGDELDRALAAVDRLSVVGLVEAFDASLLRLEAAVRPMVPEFRVFDAHANLQQAAGSTLAERLDALQSQLPAEVFAALMAANQRDLALHARVAARYGVAVPG